MSRRGYDLATRVGFWLCVGMLLLVVYACTHGCATLSEQDTQRRLLIEHETRIRRLERGRFVKFSQYLDGHPDAEEVFTESDAGERK